MTEAICQKFLVKRTFFLDNKQKDFPLPRLFHTEQHSHIGLYFWVDQLESLQRNPLANSTKKGYNIYIYIYKLYIYIG